MQREHADGMQSPERRKADAFTPVPESSVQSKLIER